MSSNIVLETLISAAYGIEKQFGNNCEVCIHELKYESLEHAILFIINSEVTGRKSGECVSNAVLKTIKKIKKGELITNHLSYLTKESNGKILKSSTVFIKYMRGKYRYILFINFDISSFIPFKSDLDLLIQRENKSKLEEIPNGAQELMEKLILKKLIGKPASIMNKDEK